MGYEAIRRLQELMPGPGWVQFWSLVSHLYSEAFFVAVLPVAYWVLHRSFARRFGTLVMLNLWLNVALKGLIARPRPSPEVVRVFPVLTGGDRAHGMPSDHAQGGLLTWGLLARAVGRRPFTVLAGLIILLIGLSRVYLGVHFPGQVLAGWLLGIVVLAAGPRLYDRAGAALARRPLGGQIALACLGPAVLAWVAHAVPAIARVGADTAAYMGVLAGLWAGSLLEERYVGYSPRAALPWQVLKVVAGLLAVIGVRGGLKAALPAGEPFTFVRYAGLGVLVTLVLPWLFHRFIPAAARRPAA